MSDVPPLNISNTFCTICIKPGHVKEHCNTNRFAIQAEASKTINHPQYYGGGDNPYEAIKVIENWQLDFCLGNVVKYIARAGKKHDDLVQDLKKAAWYLNRKIQQLEKQKP